MTDVSRDEYMAVAASREIRDGDTAFIGTGLPMVAAYLAKATHAPRVNLVFESGIIDPQPVDLATGVGDYRLVHGSTKVAGTFYALSLLQQGKVDIGFLGTATATIASHFVNTDATKKHRETNDRHREILARQTEILHELKSVNERLGAIEKRR